MLFLLGYNLKIAIHWGEDKNLVGGEIFQVKDMSEFLPGGETPPSPPVGKILYQSYLLPSQFEFDLRYQRLF